MIKKPLLFLLICLCSHSAFAQKVDTIRRKIGGVEMLSTNDVIANLSHSKQFSIFVSLVEKVGMTDSLRNMSPITVFAPDNAAFEKKGAEWLTMLEKPANKEFLKHFVMDHVFSGAITSKEIAKQIQDNKGFAMLNAVDGRIWAAKIDSNRNIVIMYHNGMGNNVITKFDIPQKNGLLFIVNDVMSPEVMPW